MDQYHCLAHEFSQLSVSFLERGYTIRFRAKGISMQPVIQDGDIVVVEPIPGSRVRIGDVVLYSNATGKPVVHRAIGKVWRGGKLHFLIKGDSLAGMDGLVPWDALLGRIKEVERSGLTLRLDLSWQRLPGALTSWWCWIKGKAITESYRFWRLFDFAGAELVLPGGKEN